MPSNALRGALLLSCLLASAGAQAAPRAAKATRGPRKGPPAAKPNTGQVAFLTSSTAYLDRGTADGLKPGDRLNFTHGTRPSGSCVLQEVAEHSATCAPGALLKGDTFALTAAKPPGVEAPAPLASPEEIARRNEALSHLQFAPVDFSATGVVTSRPKVMVAFTQATYSNVQFYGGPYQQQTVDARVYDVDLYKGLHASLDLSVYTFSKSPTTDRAGPGGLSSPTLMVRQAELSFHRDDVSLFGAVGRTWLRAPGLLTVDGAQAGWRAKDDALVLGVFGGFLPSPLNSAPQFDQFAAGVYGVARFDHGTGAQSSQLELDVRANWANRAVGGRFEAALGAHAFVAKDFDVHAAVELGVGAGQGHYAIDAARADLGWRPTESLRLYGGVRYIGISPTDLLDVGAASAFVEQTLHLDGGLRWEPTSWLWLGLSGSSARELDTLNQTFPDNSVLFHSFSDVGPDVTLPSLLGSLGGVSLGYREEFGWLRGRSGFAQLNLNVARRLRLLTRFSFYEQAPGGNNDGLLGNELGATVTLDVTIWKWLWLRAVVSGRDQLTDNVHTTGLTGGMASLQLGGTL